MASLTVGELRKQISEDKIANLYLLYGDENYLVSRAAKKLIDKAAGDILPEFNLNEFLSTAEVDKISDSVEALPLMAQRKCTAVSDFNADDRSATENAKMLELVANVPDSTVLVLYYPTMKSADMTSAKFKKLIKAADDNGVVVEFKSMSIRDLQNHLIKDAEKRGSKLSKDNAARIVEYVGNDLNTLLNENAKLSAFAMGEEITAEIIEEMVPKSLETTVFKLSDALIAGNYEKAYRLLDTLIRDKESPVGIVAVLGGTYIDMYRVKMSLENGSGVTGPASYSAGDYRGREFKLKKAERNLRGIDTAVIRESLSIILATDVALKSSRMDARILLDEMIAKLLLAARGEKSA